MTWKARLAALGMSMLEALGMAAGQKLAGKIAGDTPQTNAPTAAPPVPISSKRKRGRPAMPAGRSR